MRIGGIALVCLLTAFSVHAAEQVSIPSVHEVELAAGGTFEISNLLGSVEIVGGGRNGTARVEADVIGEAKTEEDARALAEGVRIESRSGPGPSVTATFPIPVSGELALPRDEGKSALSRLMSRVFERRTVSTEHQGRPVTLGPSRNAEKVAVHFRVQVPHDTTVLVRQAAGSVLGARFRGKVDVDTEGGTVRLEQTFGSIAVRTRGAEVEIASFQGESLSVEAKDGIVRVTDSVPAALSVRTAAGTVEAARVQAGTLSVSTGEGDIELDAVEAASFDLQSESGEIRFGTRMKGLRRGAVRTASGDVSMHVGGVTPFAVRATVPKGAMETDRVPGLQRIGEEGSVVLYRRGSAGAEIEIATETGEVTFRPM